MTSREEKRPVRVRRIQATVASKAPRTLASAAKASNDSQPESRLNSQSKSVSNSGLPVNDLRELEAVLERITPDLEKAMDLTISLILGRQKEAAMRAWARQAARWWDLAKRKGEATGQNFLAGLNLLTLRKYFLQESQRR